MKCLEEGHNAYNCKKNDCRKCGKFHHHLLHQDKQERSHHEEETSRSVSTAVVTTSVFGDTQTLLGTAVVYVRDKYGKPVKVRALLDQGSQSNIITENCAKKLSIPIEPSVVSLNGIGNRSQESDTKGEVALELHNKSKDFVYKGKALVLPTIMCDQPQQPIQGPVPVTKGLRLADEGFCTPGPIDAVLGVDLYMKALRRGLRHPKGGLGAQNTAFGWIIMGSIPRVKKKQLPHMKTVFSCLTTIAPRRSENSSNQSKVPICGKSPKSKDITHQMPTVPATQHSRNRQLQGKTLTDLQLRPEWTTRTKEQQVGQLALLKERAQQPRLRF